MMVQCESRDESETPEVAGVTCVQSQSGGAGKQSGDYPSGPGLVAILEDGLLMSHG